MAPSEPATSAGAERPRIAVLPLANFSPDPGDGYLADGLTEELIGALGRVSGLRVIARASSMRYRDGPRRPKAIGDELGVRYLLDGSVRKAGDRLRITVHLVEAASEEQHWSESFDGGLADVLELQAEIARRTAAALKVQLRKVDRDRLRSPHHPAPEAYALYLQGRVAWNRRTTESLAEALDRFRAALQREPGYARAHAGLADVHATQALLEHVAPTEAFPKARESAMQALRADPSLAEAHATLGLVHFQYDRDWSAAEAEFRRALEIDPAAPTAHQFYADYLKAMGRFDEALAEMDTALELDPLSLAIHTGKGHVLYLAHRIDEAIAQYRRALALDPSSVQAHLWFGRPFLEKGQYADAIRELRQAVELSGGSTISLAVLGHAYASAGQVGDARAILEQLRARSAATYLPSYWIALVHVGLGDPDEATRWLERAFEERSSWLAWAAVEPRLAPLRLDPRFRSILERMHLGEVRPAPTGPPVHDKERLRAFLVATGEIRLSRFQVVGGFSRYSEEDRQRLKDLRIRLERDLSASAPRTQRFLLWAPPGSGKTFLVRELAKAAGVAYRELNLGELDEPAFRSGLAELAGLREPTLALIDEIDAHPTADWPYAMLLPLLEGADRPPAPRVVVLAGSGGASPEELAERIAARPKGPDLMSRVPTDHRVALPPTRAEDRVLQALGTLRSASASRSRTIVEVEKLALAYLVDREDLANARQLREFVLRGLERVPEAEDRLRFDHLFEAGDDRGKEYWLAAKSGPAELSNRFLRLEP